ncbi:hypothetical protein MLD38_032421 [Melastoma candidum]|uniref:Uncharacterized protein n=1 Tax=Melastoma candidum TaxID=119954 RepID=A0ACB9M767_9MYRT|nr:hypothetical protein MLD38_032421 [Melastoma candidum]
MISAVVGSGRYVGVGELEEVQLFYYFAESENRPEDDPLILWLTGGPGCSGLSGLIYEVGKCKLPSNPRSLLIDSSWNDTRMIFVDSHVGTGFSYSITQQGYNTNDTKTSLDLYEFMRKWLLTHPKFLPNQVYVSGDSYGGIFRADGSLSNFKW